MPAALARFVFWVCWFAIGALVAYIAHAFGHSMYWGTFAMVVLLVLGERIFRRLVK